MSIKNQEKVEIFIQYVDKMGIPNYKCETRFSDFKKDIKSDSKIYNWWIKNNRMQKNTKLRECIEEFKEKYPKSVEIIKRALTKDKKSKKNITLFQERTKILMKYIETNDIPSGRCLLKFNEIDPQTQDNIIAGIWLQDTIANYYNGLLEEIKKYETILPNAFEKMMKKLSRKAMSIEERLEIAIKYLNYHNLLDEKNITFEDLKPNCNDQTQLKGWLYGFRRFPQLLENIQLEKYKTLYPIGYKKFLNIISSTKLSEEERIKIIMNYLSKNDKITINQVQRFCDLDSTYNDEKTVRDWISQKIKTDPEGFIAKVLSCQEANSIAYQKLKKIINEIRKRQEKLMLTYEKQVELFMKYVNTHDIPISKNTLRFCDIDSEELSEGIVGHWFIAQISKDLPKLIQEYSKYQEIYPEAYQKVNEAINNRKRSLEKERILLTFTLKRILVNQSRKTNFK